MTIIASRSSTSSTPNLSQLRTMLRASGYDFLTDSECDLILNECYLEICDMEDWPFLEADASGAAPLTVADLRKVQSVVDSTTGCRLGFVTRDELANRSIDLTYAGSPRYYYIDGGDTITTWPVGGTLAVRYWKTPVAMAAVGDEPVIPGRFRDLIVTCAARQAAMDQSADSDVQALTVEYQRRLDVMRQALLFQSLQADTVQIMHGGMDY